MQNPEKHPTKHFDQEFFGRHPVAACVFLSSHGSAVDIKRLGEVWQAYKPHVFFPELCGWDDRDSTYYQLVADGIMPPEEAVTATGISPDNYSYGAIVERMKIIYKSKALVRFMDIPSSSTWNGLHDFIREPYMVQHDPDQSIVYFRALPSFETELSQWRDYMQKSAELKYERELYMLDHFRPVIETVLATRPDIARGRPLRTLISLGSGHASWHFGLRAMGVDVKLIYENKPSQNYEDTAMRCFNIGRSVGDLFLARSLISAMVGTVVYPDLQKVRPDNERIAQFITQKVRSLSFDQCRGLYTILTDSKEIGYASLRVDRFFAYYGLGRSFVREFEQWITG